MAIVIGDGNTPIFKLGTEFIDRIYIGNDILYDNYSYNPSRDIKYRYEDNIPSPIFNTASLFGTSLTLRSNRYYGGNNHCLAKYDASVTKIGRNAFRDSSIVEITIPNTVTYIGSFAFCDSSISEIIIPDSVTTIDDWAFAQNNILTDVTIGSSVTSIGECAFGHCRNIEEINIPNSVTDIGYEAFLQCDSLNNVVFGNSVQNIGAFAFSACDLFSLNIPQSVQSIGIDAFASNDNLTTINSLGNITKIPSSAFLGCPISSMTIPSTVTEIEENAFKGYALSHIVIPNSVATIKDGAFSQHYYYELSNNRFLQSIEIGSGLSSLGVNNFLHTTNLNSISVNSSNLRYRSEGCNVLIDGDTDYVILGCNSSTIPSSAVGIAENAFYDSSIKYLNFPDSVIAIEQHAFMSCNMLETVILPENSFLSIGSESFGTSNRYRAKRLKCYVKNDVPQSLAYNAFSERELNGKIVIYVPIGTLAAYKSAPGWSNYQNWIFEYDKLMNYTASAKVSVASSAFGNSVILKNAFSGGNGYFAFDSNVQSISANAFDGKSTLTSITLPDSLTSIGSSAFKDCSSLTSITIPKSCTALGNYTFRNCASMKTMTILSDTFVSGGVLLLDCHNLESIICSNQDICPDGVSVIYKDASNNINRLIGVATKNITSYSIPDGVTSLSSDLFIRNTTLTSVSVPNTLTSISLECFAHSHISDVSLGNSIITIGESAFYDCDYLEHITIPNSVVTIGKQAFYDCDKLNEILIPDSVTSIENNAFCFDSSLTTATIGNSVTSIKTWAFRHCNKLTSITCNAIVPPSLGSDVFDDTNNCPIYVPYDSYDRYVSAPFWASYRNRLTYVIPNNYIHHKTSDNVPLRSEFSAIDKFGTGVILNAIYYDNVKDTCVAKFLSFVTTIGEDVFYGCSTLIDITIPNSVASIGNAAFCACSSLTSITVPNSVTIIGEYAFNGCSSLTSITIPNSVTSIGNAAFDGCSSLTSIIIPELVTSIKRYTFNRCSSLTSITIPNSVTIIGEYAFLGCSSLTSIIIPELVTSIGDGAFFSCDGFTSIICSAAAPPSLGIDAFSDTNNCPIYVPSASLASYQSAWSEYSERIQPIP